MANKGISSLYNIPLFPANPVKVEGAHILNFGASSLKRFRFRVCLKGVVNSDTLEGGRRPEELLQMHDPFLTFWFLRHTLKEQDTAILTFNADPRYFSVSAREATAQNKSLMMKRK